MLVPNNYLYFYVYFMLHGLTYRFERTNKIFVELEIYNLQTNIKI